jgi:hypothetical protein
LDLSTLDVRVAALTNHFPEPESDLDRAIRARLDSSAQGVDAAALWSGVRSRLEADGIGANELEKAAPRRLWRRLAVGGLAAGLAAAVLLGLFLTPAAREAVASPAQVLESAREASPRDVVRCYRVTVDLPPHLRGRFPLLAPENLRRTLCTRGDRFVVEPGFAGKGAWGRDAAGRIWVAPGAAAKAGVSFEESELSPGMRTAVKIHELELDSLLNEVLADFDLSWAQPVVPSASSYSIEATRKSSPGPFQIASASLTIEKGTNVIQRLVLTRRLHGDVSASIAFAFEGNLPNDDKAFTPEAHLSPGAPVFDHSRRFMRGVVVGLQLRGILGGP